MLEGVALEEDAQIEDLHALGRGQGGHVRAAIRPHLHQAFGLEAQERIANGEPAHPQLRGETLLAHGRAGLELPLDDAPAKAMRSAGDRVMILLYTIQSLQGRIRQRRKSARPQASSGPRPRAPRRMPCTAS